MTQNAVAYFNVEEARRSNRASEAEVKRHNQRNEQQAYESYLEAVRHNSALEALESQRLAEQARSNRASEAISMRNIDLGFSNLAETAKAHRAQEAELYRSHIMQEAELMRHNKATEFQGGVSNLISAGSTLAKYRVDSKQAATAAKQAKTSAFRAKHDVIANYWNVGNKTAENVFIKPVETIARVIDAFIPF